MKMYQERMTENTVFSLPPEIVNSVSLQRFLYVYIYSCIYLFIYLFIYLLIFFIELFIMLSIFKKSWCDVSALYRLN